MTDAQKQYVLRQQMKAIQSELGEGTAGQELRKRIAERSCPSTWRSSRTAKSIASSG
jgi:ATP-dependent Lon protease